jgi:alpha-L-rhamnosidase
VERPAGRFAKFVGSHGALRVIAQLRLEYADGTVECVGTGPDWRTREGPIVFSSIYGGEDYDARRNPTGWDLPGYDARELDAGGGGGRRVPRHAQRPQPQCRAGPAD